MRSSRIFFGLCCLLNGLLFTSSAFGSEPANLRPLYRFFDSANDQHLYSVSPEETAQFKNRAEFQEHVVIGRVATTPLPGTTRLWRAVFENNTRYSYYTGSESAVPANTLDKANFEAYVWTSPGDGRIPVYYNPLQDGTDQFYSHILEHVRKYATESSSGRQGRRVHFKNSIAFWAYPPLPDSAVAKGDADEAKPNVMKESHVTPASQNADEQVISDPEHVQFREVRLAAPVTALDITDDGKYLLAGQQALDVVSVVDVSTHQVVHQLSTAAPRCIATKGDYVYVANYGLGTVSVFSISDGWVQIDEVLVPKLNVIYISLADGPHNRNILLATCHGEGVQGSYQDCHNYAISINDDKSRKVAEKALILASKDGKSIVTVASYGLSSAGSMKSYAFKDFVLDERNAQQQWSCDVSDDSFAREAFVRGFWISQTRVYAGSPLELLSSKSAKLLIPDHRQPLLYDIDGDLLRARRLDGTLREFDKRRMSVPVDSGDFAQMTNWRERTRKYLLDLPIAFTHGDRLHLFFVSARDGRLLAADTEAFAKPEQELPPVDQQMGPLATDVELGGFSGSATASSLPGPRRRPRTLVDAKYQEGLPRYVAAGTTVRHRFPVPENASVELVSELPGAALTKDGQLTWATSADRLGAVQLKMRLESEKQVELVRVLCEVVDPDLYRELKGDLSTWDTHQRLAHGSNVTDMRLSCDRKYLLLLCGRRLVLLSPDGCRIAKELTFNHDYAYVDVRDRHLIAVSTARLDVILLDTNRVAATVDFRQFRLPISSVSDLTLNPSKRESYICVETRNELIRYQLLRFDETKATVEADSFPAKWTAVSPDGRTLFAGYQETTRAGQSLEWSPQGIQLVNHYGNIDFLLQLSLDRKLVPKQAVVDPGVNGTGIRLSAGGQRVIYLSHRGDPNVNNALVGWNGQDFDARKTIINIPEGGNAKILCFHPEFSVAAIPVKNSVALYDSMSGSRLKSQLLAPRNDVSPEEIVDIDFTPDGSHLIALWKSGSEYYTKSVTIEWASEDQLVKEQVLRSKPRKPIVNNFKPVSRGAFTSLRQAVPAGQPLTPRIIGRRYMSSVVSIHTDVSNGSGFFVGGSGYVLTNAHVVSGASKLQVRYQLPNGTQQTANAELIRADDTKDLAILKAQLPQGATVVELSDREVTEVGEPVIVIGSPGLGDEVLDQTMTTGIVSNPRREIEGEVFIQTDAPVNPGNSGGPIFDEHGHVIGMVALKGNIEAAGFAIPAPVLRKFLISSQQGGEANPEAPANENPYRTFSDMSGKFTVEARVVDVDLENKVIKLEKRDGQIITVPVGKLSDQDRAFLTERSQKGS